MFWMKVKLAAAVVGAVAVVGGGGGILAAKLAAGEPPTAVANLNPGPAPAEPAFLNDDSPLRAFMVMRTPVVVNAKGEPVTVTNPNSKPPNKPLFTDIQSPLPPADWTKPEFDDVDWGIQQTPVEVKPTNGQLLPPMAPANSLICVRTHFGVTDPAAAGDLKVWVEYVGGVVVYVNGREVARGHLPTGELKPEALAEKYPDDLYLVDDKGAVTNIIQTMKDAPYNKVVGSRRYFWEDWVAISRNFLMSPKDFDRRYRAGQVTVPAKLLRKGDNVLAMEIHRAPASEAAVQANVTTKEPNKCYDWRRGGLWAYVGLSSLRVTSASGQGVTANTARPKGIQVWSVTPYETLNAFSRGNPGEPPRPIVVNAASNSVFSGRLAVGSDQDINGLKVAVSDLKQSGGAGTLPASAIQVRCAEPAVPANSWAPPERFDGLVEAIPAKIAVPKVKPFRGQAPGAVASLWLTVRVPKSAAAGTYEGAATVSADGLPAVKVPLQVKVHGWALPDPKDFRQHHLIFLSQESVARHYNVPLWSERHFELMGKSMQLLAELNSREVPMNLARNFYNDPDGNLESMVVWVKQPDLPAGASAKEGGSYQYDFTVFDKYLDLVAKNMGKPLPLRLNCWGLRSTKGEGPNTCVKTVSMRDPATGKLEPLEQPPVGTEESYKFWKPVIEEALKKLQARGWLDVTAFGHNSYCWGVHPTTVDVARKLWPEGVWAYTAHNGTLGGAFESTVKGVSMPVKFSVGVWTEGELKPRGYRALLKPRPGIWSNTGRNRHYDYSSLLVVRNLPEEMIMRGQDGVGDFGGDMFPVKRDNKEGYYMLGCGRGTGGPADAQHAILAPGPDGVTATERFEAFREGTELAEAILFLEKALQEKKITGELEQKVSRFLDERSKAFIDWYTGFGGFGDPAYIQIHLTRWPPVGLAASDVRLLELAAEVAAAAGK